MTLHPDALLAGPRGRRLCLEVLLGEKGRRGVEDAAAAVSWAARPLAENPGTFLVIGSDTSAFVEPQVSPADAAAALGRLRATAVTGAVLDTALAVAVDLAAYWQPPYGEDVLLATDEMHPILQPVAAAIAASPLAEWWTSPVDLAAQATVHWETPRSPAAHPVVVLARWRDDIAAEENSFATEFAGRDVSGTWWSTPPTGLPRTTRVRGTTGPAGLTLVEDSLGWESARVEPVRAPHGDVIEIDGPETWAALCRRHPLPVTASRRYVWSMTTGREGAWVQPDWAAFAREAVGVHLSVAGYLTTAGRAIDVGDLGASVLAGWGPDETFWFEVAPTVGPAESWVIDPHGDERRWRRS